MNNILISFFIVTFIAGYSVAHSPVKEVEAQPVTEVVIPTATPQPIKYTNKIDSLPELPKNYKEIVKLIQKHFGRDYYTAVRIAHCESRLRQDRVHRNSDNSLDVGLFQISQKWHANKGNAYDLEENIRIAKEIKDKSGWQSWVCFNKYSYGW